MPAPSRSSRKNKKLADTPPENPLVPHAKLRQLYILMVKSRLLAERIVRDARKRRTDRRIGHEASRVAIALGLQAGDIAVTAISDHVVPVAVGMPIKRVASGEHSSPKNNVQVVRAMTNDENQFAFACGLGLALRDRNKNENIVVAFGDAIARETLTYASEQKLPIVFVVENRAPVDVAGHASQRGVAGFTVDGNDAVAVYRVSQECFDRARRGLGPSFIECKAPGWKGRLRFERAMHRDVHELDDPILYLERYLANRRLVTEEWKRKMRNAIANDIRKALARDA
jgi:TPP-dependent pyruvate/acetoin dehydrogenase alpha subunit